MLGEKSCADFEFEALSLFTNSIKLVNDGIPQGFVMFLHVPPRSLKPHDSKAPFQAGDVEKNLPSKNEVLKIASLVSPENVHNP